MGLEHAYWASGGVVMGLGVILAIIGAICVSDSKTAWARGLGKVMTVTGLGLSVVATLLFVVGFSAAAGAI